MVAVVIVSAIRDAQGAEEALEEYRISLAVERVQEAQRAADALLSYRGRDRAAKLRDARAIRAAAEADLDYMLERRGVSRES